MSYKWENTSDPRIKRRNKQLYYRASKKGIRIEQKLHETTLTAAKKAADDIDEALRQNKALNEIKKEFGVSSNSRKQKANLIGELWPHFIEYRKEGDSKRKLKPWREKTLYEYNSYWARSFASFFEDKLPEEIEELWPKFIKAERKRSSKGDALVFDNYVKYMSAFGRYLKDFGYVAEKPHVYDPNWGKESNSEKEEDGHGIVFSDETVRKMIKNSDGAFGLYIKMLALQGMRSSEVTQLQKDRIKLDDDLIKLRAIDVKTGSKTGVGRSVPIHPLLKPYLRAQMKASDGSIYLFPNKKTKARPMNKTGFKKRFNKLKEDCKIKDGWPHCLRHTYATKAFANENLNPVLVCKALGMSMNTAMKHYIHFDEKDYSKVSANISFGKLS